MSVELMREFEAMPGGLTLRNVLERSGRLYGNDAALGYVGKKPVRHGELVLRAGRLSRFLEERGIGAGDRVVLLSENGPFWGVVYFAVTAMGAVVVPVLPEFHRNEIRNILEHSEAKAVFVSARYLEKVEPDFPRERIFAMEQLLELTGGNGVWDGPAVRGGDTGATAADASASGFGGTVPSADDLASIIYTSGTTGQSKGVMLSHRNIVWDAVTTLERVEMTRRTVMLSILPLAHVYECTLGFIIPIIAGAVVYYLEKPPVASVLLPALQEVRPTMMLSVPLVIEKIYRSKVLPKFTSSPVLKAMYRLPPARKLLNRIAGKKVEKSFGGRLQFFGIGGSLLASDVEQFLRDAGFPYAIGYGLTETSPLVAGTDASSTRFRSTGPVLRGVEVRIASPDAATGEGEIQVRGPNVMMGYYRNPDRTREVFTDDGWFKTGDLGVFDRQGYLFIRGRLKNMILGPSGENIYPEEIEATINRFSYVLESLVYQQKGQIVALVQFNYEELAQRYRDLKAGILSKTQEGVELLNQLRREVNANLNSFSRIGAIIEQEQPFEKTPTNKIKRYLYVPEKRG